MSYKMPTYLVTGCSSGIGLDLCKRLLFKGNKVVATCRNRSGSMTKTDLITDVEKNAGGNLVVLEGIDVTNDDVGTRLIDGLAKAGVSELDVVIHNAGGVCGFNADGAGRAKDTNPTIDQSLFSVTPEMMRSTFEVNTLGPLKVQQAITKLMKSNSGGKVVIISTGLGSISDNGSGGSYAYRVSKAGVNMVGKCFAADLNKDPSKAQVWSTTGEELKTGIAVAIVNPGFIATEFGPGRESLEKWGAKPVEQASLGILKAIDQLTLENTGKYWMVRTTDGELVEFQW